MTTALGFTSKQTLATESATNVKELIEQLEAFCKSVSTDPEFVYIENGATDGVTLRLVENTLTDGSKTYDIRVSY